MTTMRDVADRAQVSIATVSRVINDHPSVNPAIRQAVRQAIDELHFQPNGVARTLRTAKTRTLALLVSGMRNPDLLSPLLQGAEAVAHENGYALFVGNTRRDRKTEEQYLRNLVGRRVDGILCSPSTPHEEIQALAERSGVPIVLYGRTAPTPVLPHTVLHFTTATEEAIDHLLSLGHRRIGTVTHTSESSLDVKFGWGASFIRHALQARGLEIAADHQLFATTNEECTAAVEKLFAAGDRPTAIFVTNLFLVPPTLAGIRAAGARVPDDVTLIGCGDSDWAQWVDPPLSVVAADLRAHLADATRLLLNLVNPDLDLPAEVEHRARYIRRASVQAPPVAGNLAPAAG